MYFIFIILYFGSALADKDDVLKLIRVRNELLGRQLESLPLYGSIRPPYSGLFPANQVGILNGANRLPLSSNGFGIAGDGIERLYNSQYRIPAELFNPQQLIGLKLPTNDLAFPKLFNTAKDHSYDSLPQTRRQLAARAILSAPNKFSVDDLINLLLIQLLTTYEGNHPERIASTYPKYIVDQPLVPNLDQHGYRLHNPSLQLSSYLTSSNGPRNPMPYSYQKRGRSLNEKSTNQNELVHKSNFEALTNPSNSQNIDDNIQQSFLKETVVPMFSLPNNIVEPPSDKELERRIP